jgi:hypothetical protein
MARDSPLADANVWHMGIKMLKINKKSDQDNKDNKRHERANDICELYETIVTRMRGIDPTCRS